MFGFMWNLWKKRKVNRTQSRVLGDSDEILIAQKRILVLSQTLDEVVEAARPYVAAGGVARRVFNMASEALKV